MIVVLIILSIVQLSRRKSKKDKEKLYNSLVWTALSSIYKKLDKNELTYLAVW